MALAPDDTDEVGRLNVLVAWLQNFTRLEVHWEYHVDNYLGLLLLGLLRDGF